jgi:hypothetical protein
LARASPSHLVPAFASIARLIVVRTGIRLYSTLSAHQAVKRAAKADAEVGLKELHAKLALRVAWNQRRADDHDQFVGAETAGAASKDKLIEIVAVNKQVSIMCGSRISKRLIIRVAAQIIAGRDMPRGRALDRVKVRSAVLGEDDDLAIDYHWSRRDE